MAAVPLTRTEVLGYLSSTEGRETLATYGSTLDGHAALAAHLPSMPNTIASSLLTEVLREAAVRAVLEDSGVLEEQGHRYSVAAVSLSGMPARPDTVFLDEAEGKSIIRRALMEKGRLSNKAVNECFEDGITVFSVAVAYNVGSRDERHDPSGSAQSGPHRTGSPVPMIWRLQTKPISA